MDSQPPPKLGKPAWGPISALLITAVAYLASQLIVLLPIGVVLLAKPHQDIQSLLNNSSWFNLVVSGLSATTILVILWLYLHSKKLVFKDLGFRRLKVGDFGWLALGIVVYFGLVAVVLGLASHIPGFNANQAQNVGYQGVGGWQLVLAFIGLVVLPPLAEEMLFRGFLYRGLAARWTKIVAALATSALFGLVHFQWNVGLDVFILSLVLIFLLEKTGNLWVCVGLHAVKNLLAFLTLFVLVGH